MIKAFKKIEDICIFLSKSRRKAGDGLNAGKYLFYTSSETQSKFINTADFLGPAIVIGTGGKANIHFIQDSFSTSADCISLKSRDDDIKIEFVYWYLFSNMSVLEDGFRGAGLKHISKDYIKNLRVPIPSSEKQEEVIRSFNAVKSLIEKRRQSITKLDQLTQSIFLEMFGDPVTNPKGWPVKQLRNIANIKIGPFGSLLHKSDYISNGIPLVNPTHLINNKIVIDPDLSLTNKKHQELSSYHLQEGDVVLGRRGEMGRCGLVTSAENGYLCGTGSMFIRPSSELDSIFILHLLTSEQLRKELGDKALGVTMKNLNAGTVASLCVICPEIAIQEQFAEAIKSIELLTVKAKKSLNAICDLQGSLMDVFFNS